MTIPRETYRERNAEKFYQGISVSFKASRSNFIHSMLMDSGPSVYQGFGCYEPSAWTIIHLPNYKFSHASGTSTFKFEYTPDETAGMFENGNAVATQNGDEEWPLCLACGILTKSGQEPPSGCNDCLAKYCIS